MRASPTDTETIAAAVAVAADKLSRMSDTPRLDAEVLLTHCCGVSRTRMLAYPEQPLSRQLAEQYTLAVRRRAAGEPVAYIVGQREFYSLPLKVSPSVLVPRQETELLVDCCLALNLDLGTGSGAVALAVKSARPDFDLTAVDADPDAIRIAEANASALGLAIRCIHSDWFGALSGEQFDIVLCNPPYIPSTDAHFNGPLRHEPRQALDGGVDGLDAYRQVLATANGCLAVGAQLLFEHGFDQRAALMLLASECGFRTIGCHEDLAGHPRVLALVSAASEVSDAAMAAEESAKSAEDGRLNDAG
jgi:release factor glutamine methyltransferase